jgi:hypothetical protein
MHPWAFAQETCAKGAKSTGERGITPAFPAQWFTAYFALSPVNQLDCHRRSHHSRELSACMGAPGPHDFAVRETRRSSFGAIRVHRSPAPRS